MRMATLRNQVRETISEENKGEESDEEDDDEYDTLNLNKLNEENS